MMNTDFTCSHFTQMLHLYEDHNVYVCLHCHVSVHVLGTCFVWFLFLLFLCRRSSISTEHLEVISALQWPGWLFPIKIMDGYYCLLAVSQIKPICPRMEAYRAIERTLGLGRGGAIYISHFWNCPCFTNLLAQSQYVTMLQMFYYVNWSDVVLCKSQGKASVFLQSSQDSYKALNDILWSQNSRFKATNILYPDAAPDRWLAPLAALSSSEGLKFSHDSVGEIVGMQRVHL